MSNKKKRSSSEKIRVEFKKNRNSRTRINDWTRRYQNESESQSDDSSDPSEISDLFEGGERISGKGDITRKRTIVATRQETEINTGIRGDFEFLPEINADAVDSGVILNGRVLKVHGLYSYVEDHSGRIFVCVIRRILKTLSTAQRQIVVAGDRVLFRDAKVAGRNEGIIERVEPRRGTLSRTSRQRKHIIVSNIDQALIIGSAMEPHLKPNLIDRLLITCERSGIEPIICINKIDLVNPATLQPLIGVYAQMGYKVLLLSTKEGFGIDRLRRILSDRESVVVGQSGVGKSSLLNAADPSLDLRVGEVSLENEKGKHTTTTAELIRLSFGGYVVDTPGIRQFMLWDIIPEEVAGFFKDLRPFENHCRFPDCTHASEEGCAVKKAVAQGQLDSRRYASYLAFRAGEAVK
ncbi:MAG: ribosome small subunit-dependent GTPase A [Planctomycetia bacterium]|nr:ribosome small subunit-dependent GTPase A [Planctomycetia bacterium]